MSSILYIFCEGHTEESVLRSALHSYWSIRFNDCDVIRFSGAGDLKARFSNEAMNIFYTEPNASILCLVDLYQEPFGVYDQSKMSVNEGFNKLKAKMYNSIDPRFHYRFGAFPVVMEIETWILADYQIQKKLGKYYQYPETIDHPSMELKKWRVNYNKKVDGLTLFREISLKRVYEDSCPHFVLLIDWITNEPEKPLSEHSKQRQKLDKLLEVLIQKHTEAINNCDKSLQNNDVEQAIYWDNKRQDYEKEIEQRTVDFTNGIDS